MKENMHTAFYCQSCKRLHPIDERATVFKTGFQYVGDTYYPLGFCYRGRRLPA